MTATRLLSTAAAATSRALSFNACSLLFGDHLLAGAAQSGSNYRKAATMGATVDGQVRVGWFGSWAAAVRCLGRLSEASESAATRGQAAAALQPPELTKRRSSPPPPLVCAASAAAGGRHAHAAVGGHQP